jgi:hypothetical protein
MRTVRVVFAVVAMFLSLHVSAYPVTYNFTGSVTSYTNEVSSFNPIPGDPISGSVTYDAAYEGEFFGGPWPTPHAVLDWTFEVNGEAYFQQIVSPLVQFAFVDGNKIGFFDEMPANSPGAAIFDQGGFGFEFANDLGGVVPNDLPVEDFLTGSFSWGGGVSFPGASLLGTIDSLVAVPEPSSFALLLAGLAGLLINRRNARC